MVVGFEQLRKALTVSSHTVVNDAARDIVLRVEREEKSLKLEAQQISSDEMSTEVLLSATATLSDASASTIGDRITKCIENTFRV